MERVNKALILSTYDGQNWIYLNGKLIKKNEGNIDILDLFRNDNILVGNIAHEYLPNKKFRNNRDANGIEEYVAKLAQKKFDTLKYW